MTTLLAHSIISLVKHCTNTNRQALHFIALTPTVSVERFKHCPNTNRLERVERFFCICQLGQYLWLNLVKQSLIFRCRRVLRIGTMLVSVLIWLRAHRQVSTSSNALYRELMLMTSTCSLTTVASAYSITAHYTPNESFSPTTLLPNKLQST